ncbi:MAG: PRC-barrel domain-containing protein [Atopobiaceae bacterium]|nr:PRC-barrel domain-containing protein [Atopobiaceae bacterium]
MLTTKQLTGRKVYRIKERRNKEDKLVRLGKVHQVVFAPDGRSIVGVTVRRPDIAGMVKQDDVFVARDSLLMADKELVVTGGDEAFDDAARKRLSIDWDRCLIWDGMDARTESGKELGYVGEVTLDLKTGEVGVFRITDGGVSNALVGCVEIPAHMFRRYERGFLVVDNAAAKLELSGGAAGKAGAAYGKAKAKGKEAGKKAGEAAGVAFDKGTYGLGRALGKARRAVTEAIQDDAEPAQLAVEEALVEEPPRALPQAAPAKKPKKGDKKGDKSKKGKKKAKKDGTPKASKPAERGTTDTTELADKAVREVGRQLGRTRDMFAAFKREFDESSK